MQITNCHVHIFTLEHVPSDFLPPILQRLLGYSSVRIPLIWFLRNIFPFTDRDILDRYMQFLEVAASKKQCDVLKRIREFYPKNTRFVILPMDMAFMSPNGKIKKDLESQLQELTELYRTFPNMVIPFVPVDPRRSNVFDLVKRYVEDHDYKGIKIYPRLGFYPNDPALLPIYEYAQANDLPIMSHCSRGGVYTRKITDKMLDHPWRGRLTRNQPREFSHYFTEPKNFQGILSAFPELKVCLAHFGGNIEWDNYFNTGWDPEDPDEENKSWLSEIIDMINNHENLYTDISYTLFSDEKYFPLLKVWLSNPAIRQKVLFGSDYYMIEQEKKTEREMSIRIRAAINEENYRQICEINPKAFLGF